MVGAMASWAEFERDQPELAGAVRERLEAHKHKTIATLRKDGSPRISGIECEIEDGELRFGSMLNGVKALDLVRDPRFALHSGSDDPPAWDGDAKLAGVAVEISREGMHLFRCEIHEVVLVRLNGERTKMVIDAWHEGRGTARIER
jgi:Pyridoxamine 5'-phosphate oxidase